MDYREFLLYRSEKLAKEPGFVDAGDLDLYGKFPKVENLFTDASGGHIGDNIHRCHLVEDFLREYELDEGNDIAVEKKLVSYSMGVRQSLVVLMDLYRDKKWLIASDNYPYYQNLAQKIDLGYKTFNTLGCDGFADMMTVSTDEDILLVTYPFKPSGQSYSEEDWQSLRNWLQVDSARRLVLDAVYLFELKEEKELFKLFFETQQIVILYSLSKSHAAPMVAGFTFTFDNEIREAFKNIPRDERLEDTMRTCFSLLNLEAGKKRREEIRCFIQNKKASAVSAGVLPENYDAEGYLFYLTGANFNILEEKGILTVPSSVYLSEAKGVVISTLSM